MRERNATLIPTRATLLGRLKNWDDHSSWQAFFDAYWQLIYGVARKSGLSDSEAQDVVQETMTSVAKHMPKFKYDPALGSFKAWLLKLVRWRIIEQVRKRIPFSKSRSASATSAARTDTIHNLPDPAGPALERMWELEWKENVLKAAIENVKRKLDPQKYQIFDCYVNKGWSAEKVAATFGIPVSQVYMAKNRITEKIKAEAARLEKEMT